MIIHTEKEQIILNKNTIIFLCFGFIWVLKNIIVSGCLFYPIQKTCFKSLIYYDEKQTEQAVFVSEAWAKGWSDQKKEILNYQEYNEDFNWLKTWSNNHLFKIYEKLTPFVIFLSILVRLT